LVGRGLDGIEREWVILGCSDFLLDQNAQDADLIRGELHTYKGATEGVTKGVSVGVHYDPKVTKEVVWRGLFASETGRMGRANGIHRCALRLSIRRV